MTRLGAVISEAIVHHYGRDELLRRLAHPFWFQSFGAVMGMDWHSSGITTSVIGALKRGLAPLEPNSGFTSAAGAANIRGKRPTSSSQSASGSALTAPRSRGEPPGSQGRQRRGTGGFDLYLHGFIVTDDGRWVVVQQGMNGVRRQARRYHWLSEGLKSFVEEPHAAIEGPGQGEIVNLTDRRADASRAAQLDILHTLGPDGIARELRSSDAGETQPRRAGASASAPSRMPAHHDVRPGDVFARRLRGNLAAAADRGPADFAELLLVPGVGPRTVRSLAMVAEIVHGAPYRFADPARFSFAHGGKDRHPFPVPLRVYDQTIEVLKSAVRKARLGRRRNSPRSSGSTTSRGCSRAMPRVHPSSR